MKVATSLWSVGDRAPYFSLPNQDGVSVSSDTLKGKTFILYFYPKDHTPGCTQESCDFRDHYQAFQKAGIEIFGISKDSEKSHLSFKEKQSLPFDLLADTSGEACEAFGVWKEKSMYGKSFMGIERTTFVINGDGLFTQIYPKVSVSEHVNTILKDLGLQ